MRLLALLVFVLVSTAIIDSAAAQSDVLARVRREAEKLKAPLKKLKLSGSGVTS